MQSIKLLAAVVAGVVLSTPAIGQSCAAAINNSSSAAKVIECVKTQAVEIDTLRAQLEQEGSTKEALVLANRRLACAKLALDVAWKRLESNRDYVELAAGTYANHPLRNSMLLEWRNAKIPSVDEKIQQATDYLVGRRQGC